MSSPSLLSPVAGDLRGMESFTNHLVFSWRLDGFTKLDSKPGKCYRSGNFFHPSVKENWCFKIYPGGIFDVMNKKKPRVYCSLNLVGFRSIEFKCTMSFRTINEEIIRIARQDDESLISDMILSFGRLALLQKLDNDVLVVTLEIKYSMSSVVANCAYEDVRDITPCRSVLDDFAALLDSDVLISVGEIEIPAHSAILSARSEVFAAMFKHDTIEKKSNRIEIVDFDSSTIKMLLCFIYTGMLSEFEFTTEALLELLRAADKYRLDCLVLYCGSFLSILLDEDNALSILMDADRYNVTRLKSRALEYICDKWSSIDLKKYESLLNVLSPKLLSEILLAVHDSS